MDNNIIESAANKIDKQKKRSKLIKMLKEVPEVNTPEKSKRSFWRNLFKFKTKQADHSEAQAHRLNTIYEESQSADEKNTEMELEQIKNTLRDIANNSNPSILITGLIAHNIDVPKDDLLHDDLAGYLTDDSSEQDEDEVEEEEKKIAHLNSSPESEAENTITSIESEVNKPVVKEEGKKISEEKLNVKDAYSFEYSEKSGNSSEEVAEDKPDKVKFDEKVEAKDVDNNIVVTPLNETESKTQELQDELLKPLNANETTEEKLTDDLKNSNLKANSSSEQKKDSKDSFPIADEARSGLEEIRCNGTSENWLHCEEDLNNSTPSSFHKLEATESSEICEEYVIWSKKLNDFSDIAQKSTIPALDIKNGINNDDPRFENNFTMISGNRVHYSIAFDPLFNDFAAKQLEENNKKYADDKQKVIRKRKMMSLLHDKQIFKDYMKEIEENDTQNNKKDYKYDDAPLDSSLTKDSQNIPHELCKLFSKLPQNNLYSKDSSSNNSEKSTTEETISILERTKNKLAKILQKDCVLEPKIQSLYPNNYLEKFNFKNRIPAEKVSNNNSIGQTDISTIDSNILSAVSHEKINTSEALLFQVHSLSSKMINSEDALEKIQANQKMQILIDELMLNINELQETCIQIGTSISDHSSDPLVSFTPIGDSEAVVSPIIEELLNTLFEDNLKHRPEYGSQQIGKVKLDCTEVNTNSVPYYSSLERTNSLNFKLIPMIHNINAAPLSSTLKTNVEHATGLLTAIYDEMCQFNPIAQPLCQENSCFETFDLDDNSVESLGIMRSFENVSSDLNSSLEKTRHSLDELRETLNISDDFELPITTNMSDIENNSHFNFDRFSYHQPNQSVCKPDHYEPPEIEKLNNSKKNSQFNLDTTFSQAADNTKRNTNNNFKLPHTVNLSNDTKDSQLGLRKKLSSSKENRKNQQILNEASKISLPLSDNEDDDESDIEVENNKHVAKNAENEEKNILTNNMLKNVFKIPLASNVIKKEKTISATNMILDEPSKICVSLSDDEDEIENDKNQEKKIDKHLLKNGKTISLTKLILNEACKILLPLSDDEEEVKIDKHNTNKISKQILKKEETMALDEASKIPLPLSDDEEGVDMDKHQEKEGNELLINNVHKQLHKNDEIISLLNIILDDVSKGPLALSDEDDHGKVNSNKNVEDVVRKRENISPILSKIQNKDNTTKYKSENVVRTTTFESQPGTSKQGQSLVKARKSSTILLPRLPSVPSTEITCLSLEEETVIRTILRADMSSFSSTSNNNSLLDREELNWCNFSYFPNYSFDGTSTPLERKASKTNLTAGRNHSNSVPDDVTESELDFYIHTNIRDFEESIKKTIDYNIVASEAVNSSKLSTLEDSITTISPTSTNLLSKNEGKENASSIHELQSSTTQLLQNTTNENDDDLNFDLSLNSLENNAIEEEEIIQTKNNDKNLNKPEH